MIGKKTIWTPKMVKHLQDNYRLKNNKQLAAFLGLKLTVVRMKLYELGLARYNQKQRAWTPEEDIILKSFYQTIGDKEIGKKLNRPKGGVRKRRITLGLIRTIPEIKKLVDRNLTALQATQFKQGCPTGSNMTKAWQTRRKLDSMPQSEILKRIEHREKANFYRI